MESARFVKTINLFSLAILLFFSSGCYFRATITPAVDDTPAPEASNGKTATHEIASGARAYISTPSSYKVRHAVGFNVPKQKQTTPLGYQVYNHVQGIISSDEVK